MFTNLNIFRSIIAILILFIPLYPKFPLDTVTGTYVAIRVDDIVIALSILVWVVYQVKKGFPVLKLKITTLFICYFLAIIASTITAIFVYQTDSPHLLILNTLRRFEYMTIFFITIQAIKSRQDFKYPFIFLLIANLFVYIYAFGQKYLHFPVVSTMNSEFSKGILLQMDVWTRVSSTFAGHYDLAAYLSVVLIIILSLISLIKGNRFLKLVIIFLWFIGFEVLTFTASRISTFAYWGGISLSLFLIRKYLWIIPVSILMIFSLFSSKDLNQRLLATIPQSIRLNLHFPSGSGTRTIPSLTPTPTLPPIVAPISPVIVVPGQKVATPTPTKIPRPTPTSDYLPIDSDVGVARSGEIRFNAEWPRAITAYRKNFLTGTGLGSITLATDNDYLRLLGESGLLGFLTFISIPLFFIIHTIPLIFKKSLTSQNYLSLILFSGLLATLANAIFIDIFEASKTAYSFWIMMGIYYQSLFLKTTSDD